MTRGVRARLIGSLLAATIVLSPGLLVPAAASAQPTTPDIQLEGAKNFRDIGGYLTADGRRVREDLVYRSNRLSKLTDSDQAKLTAANVTLDVDLRNAVERKDEPDRLPAGVEYKVADVVSLNNGLGFHEFVPITLGRAIIDAAVKGSSDIGQSIGYPFMVSFQGSDVAFRDLLTAIAQQQSGAVVYHCSAGKDRTGWATAVLLTILGVPRATVNAEFLASNTFLGRSDAVEQSWLDAAFDQVNRLYGSFDRYVRDGLRLDQNTVNTLRAKLLV
jgi:protein-tyrosine phosphatase